MTLKIVVGILGVPILLFGASLTIFKPLRYGQRLRRRLTFFDPKDIDVKNLLDSPSAYVESDAIDSKHDVDIEQTHDVKQQAQSHPRLKLPPPSSEGKGLIPSSLDYLADLSDEYTKENPEVPFFWHVAKSGGSTIKDMYSNCYGLVEASESGVTEGHENDAALQVVTLEHGWKFLNVDTTIPTGIERAARMDTVQSGMLDLLVSPLPYEAVPKLFSNEHKARFFSVFRDPIERVVSIFYYLQKAKHEPTYNPALATMTLEEYVFSDLAESNFVSRCLIDKMEAAFVEEDFLVASEILKTKVLIGLLDEMEESVRRFDSYFEFDKPKNAACVKGYLKTGSNRHSHPGIPPSDSPVYKELLRKNHMDVRLYKYAVELFREQASMFSD
eukprot:CAMPEP_0194207016 /NCGR_PEP_ID=MMETSP0156-20130528/5892_1 /TAXON_ID=33649 /ORGANISM="Thalassionema nitzschioides, Strain L26-B" /LENGTH=385 /DNA_ID=CAMNT_0038933687 /DNA_START=67 /DNA_END=1224 /DNA_ORIENTATION=-